MATQEDFERIGNYARMYNQDQNIDRRKSSRVVPLEVLSLGYSRTGTLSMHNALTTLGYPTYHFSSMYDNVKDCDAWMDLLNAKFEGKGTLSKAQFDGIIGHVSATTDMPCISFAAELIAYYPDAKVVLVERNIDSWYASWSAFLDEAMNPFLWAIARLDPGVLGRIAKVGGQCTDLLNGSPTSLAAGKARSKEEYKKHYAFIRAITPKDRLLELDLKQGWKPLCDFLNKPVPDQPFPHVNDSASNKQGFKEMGIMAMKRILMKGTMASVLVGVAAFAAYKIR